MFTISVHNELYALNVENRQKGWSNNLQQKFGSNMLKWGDSTSLLVDGRLLLIEVSGRGEKSIVAFETSEAVIWGSYKDKLGYP